MIIRSIRNRWRSDQIDWDELWLTQAHLIAMRSRCSRDRIGAVIVSHNNMVVGQGYNGAAPIDPNDRGVWCRDWCPRARANPPGNAAPANGYVDCPATHAEINALLRMDGYHLGATLYCTDLPCYSCAKFIVACWTTKGIRRLAVPDEPGVGYRDPQGVLTYLADCHVQVDRVILHG